MPKHLCPCPAGNCTAARRKAVLNDAPLVGALNYIKRQSREIRQLRRAIRTLIAKSDLLESAITGVTDQFETELAALSHAASAAEKLLNKKET